MTQLGDALVANDWNAIHPACVKVGEATVAMNDALPTPDERLNDALRGLLDELNAAVVECPSLHANSDRVDTFAFVSAIERAMEHMKVVQEIMK